MFKKWFFALAILMILSLESIWISAEPTWTSLRVTWGLNLFSSRAFAKLPRTESKARRDGFEKLKGECSGKFLGTRYIKGLDTSVVLLYDTKGYIAGIQSGIPKNDAERNGTSFSFQKSQAYQVDKIGEEDIYFLTAYFVDPIIICNNGRSKSEYEEQGTGTGLYLQNGTNPIDDVIAVPHYEVGMNETNWVRGGCFPSMGVHYWYDMKENFDCQYFYPFTVIYNRGKITSFAFASIGKYEFSSRFEHPPKSSFSRFLPTPVPQCILDESDIAEGITTLHVYFTVRPWNLFC